MYVVGLQYLAAQRYTFRGPRMIRVEVGTLRSPACPSVYAHTGVDGFSDPPPVRCLDRSMTTINSETGSDRASTLRLAVSIILAPS